MDASQQSTASVARQCDISYFVTTGLCNNLCGLNSKPHSVAVSLIISLNGRAYEITVLQRKSIKNIARLFCSCTGFQ